MTADTLKKYLSTFGSLHRNKNPRLGDAPHKPLLLLTVLDEVAAGRITKNLVPLDSDLIVAFHQNWLARVPPETWEEKIALPFRYLVYDGFWELVQGGTRIDAQQLSSPSIRQLQSLDGARLALDLWDLLQTPMAVQALRVHLLQTYFPPEPQRWQPLVPRQALDYEVERLAAQAQSRFRTRRVQEPKDDVGYYVRHTLFPRVIKSFYDDTCAVCRLKAGALNGTLVEAAHIMPFAEFHNDHPRNGLALCKNHHWGFDAGWFTATDDYRLVASPHLRQPGEQYLIPGAPLHLPPQPEYAPAVEALAWHRAHKFLK